MLSGVFKIGIRRPERGVLTEDEVLDLDFEADGDLLLALNEAYVGLLKVHDRDLRIADRELDQQERSGLQVLLNRIIVLCEVED
jgi:hypothetical protein